MHLNLPGKKIKIRKYKLSDAKDLYKNIKDKEITKWTCSIPSPYPKNEALRFIKRNYRLIKNKKAFSFAICLIGTDKVIGGIALTNLDWKEKSAELGYWVGKKYWGKGLTTEAVKLALKFSFDKLKLHRIWARVFEENVSSVRILKRCKFKLEGKRRESRFRYGKWHNELMFSILSKEFFGYYK